MQSLTHKQKDQEVALVDVLDRVLDKGAVVQGDVAVRLADVDLIYIGLRLVVTSVSKMESIRGGTRASQLEERLTKEDVVYLNKLEEAIRRAEEAIPKVIKGSDAEKIEQGITRLVLTVTELLRRLMEREAVRQVKMNHLTTRETQRLGMALKALAKKMEELRVTFGLEEDDLNLDLGPLGNLV